ncbi:MAG: class I SAM-dependent methyltransferase [Steroidobacteraceae bacterium]
MTPNRSSETERVRGIYDKLAPRFDRKISFWEKVLFGGGREWVCSQAKGDTLEIAVGTGRNFALYPTDVRLSGIELSPQMLEIARDRARDAGRRFDLRVADAEALPFPDASFDTVVCTLSLCSIPDDRKAVAEARRVLRPGGTFLLLEHVRSANPVVRAGQRLLEPINARFEGDHLLREPLEHLRIEGFEIEQLERSKAGIVERVRARKPA